MSREQWEQLRRELNADGKTVAGTQQRKHTWTGLLRCWRCGGLLGARRVNGKMSYSCRSSHFDRWDAGRQGGCQGTSIRQAPADQFLDDLLLTAIEEMELGAPDHQNASAQRLEEAVEETVGRLDALADEFTMGALTAAAYSVASRKVTERLEELRRDLREELAKTRTKLRLDPQTVRSAWPDLPPMDRRALAAAFFSRVVVQPARRGDNRFDVGRLEVHWV